MQITLCNAENGIQSLPSPEERYSRYNLNYSLKKAQAQSAMGGEELAWQVSHKNLSWDVPQHHVENAAPVMNCPGWTAQSCISFGAKATRNLHLWVLSSGLQSTKEKNPHVLHNKASPKLGQGLIWGLIQFPSPARSFWAEHTTPLRKPSHSFTEGRLGSSTACQHIPGHSSDLSQAIPGHRAGTGQVTHSGTEANSWVLAREQRVKRRDSASWLAQTWLKNLILGLGTGLGNHTHTVTSSPEGWEVPWQTCKIKHRLFLILSIPCSIKSVWTEFPIALLF